MGSDSFKKQQYRNPKSLLSLVASFMGGFILAAFFFQGPSSGATNSTLESSSACQISFGTYEGPTYTTTETVGTPKCLVESKFLKLQQHAVQMAVSDETTSNIIPDWLFVDYHDQINVLVEAPSNTLDNRIKRTEEPEFLIFEQSKYALEGRTSKAVVGGLVEPGEDPAVTAKREVEEEMHVTCQEWIFLGRYRADVNRGAGWTSCYLARQCKTVVQATDGETDTADQVGAKDTEKQTLQTIGLSDLSEYVMEGDFLEIKWSATVALSLLHYYG